MLKIIKKIIAVLLSILLAGFTGCLKQMTYYKPYSITTETFSQDEINIQYPQIYGFKDDAREKAINNLIINDLIETQISKSIESLAKDTDILVLNMAYEVTMHTSELLSILYTGQSTYYTGRPQVQSSYRNANEVYAITIDLKNVKKVHLSNFTTIDNKLVQKIKQSSDVINEPVKNGFRDQESLIGEIKEQRDQSIIDGFAQEWTNYTFCVRPNSLIVSIGISQAGGDYALIKIPVQYKKYIVFK